MKDESKTKKQLINELVELRHRIAEFEELGIEYKDVKKERDRLFNFSIDMLCIAGFDGYFKKLNPAWGKTLGWKIEELLSKPYLDFVHAEDRESTISAAKALEGGKTVITFENRYLCKDGSYKWISWNSFPLIEENLIFAIARDITEQKITEQELKRAYDGLEV
jgi:two-component system NtrC family sensor kinase